MQGVPSEPSASLSTSSEGAKPASLPPSDDRLYALVEALHLNSQAMLALVQSIRELIEFGTSQQQEAEQEQEDFPTGTLDGPPIKRN